MKKIILLVVLISLSGCQLVNEIADVVYEDRFSNQELTDFHLEDENFKTIEDIGRFLRDNIIWESGTSTPVQSPKETWEKKTGNCEDFSVLFIDIAFFELGIKCELVLVDQNEMERARTIEAEGIINHAIIRYSDIIYELQNGYIYTGTVNYYYAFNEVFN